MNTSYPFGKPIYITRPLLPDLNEVEKNSRKYGILSGSQTTDLSTRYLKKN